MLPTYADGVNCKVGKFVAEAINEKLAKQKLNIHGVVRPDPNCPHCMGSGGVPTGYLWWGCQLAGAKCAIMYPEFMQDATHTELNKETKTIHSF